MKKLFSSVLAVAMVFGMPGKVSRADDKPSIEASANQEINAYFADAVEETNKIKESYKSAKSTKEKQRILTVERNIIDAELASLKERKDLSKKEVEKKTRALLLKKAFIENLQQNTALSMRSTTEEVISFVCIAFLSLNATWAAASIFNLPYAVQALIMGAVGGYLHYISHR